MMRTDAGLHADQARRQVSKAYFNLTTRPLLPKHDRTARIVADNMERVLADIDADYGDRGIGCLRHGVLLVFGAPCQLRLLAGQEHGRTIPLPEVEGSMNSCHRHSAKGKLLQRAHSRVSTTMSVRPAG